VILAVAVALTALGLYCTSPSASAPIQASQVAWSPPLALVRIAWVALDAAVTVAGLLLWRERRRSAAAHGAVRLLAVTALLHLGWLVAFLVTAPVRGPHLWLVLLVLLALDLATAALACTAWAVSRPAALLLFVALAGLVGGTALAVGDTALTAALL
jgi:tryptophan-rich sensory protein